MQYTKSLSWHCIWHWSKNAAFIIYFQWHSCSFAASFSVLLPKTADFYDEKLAQLRFLAVAVWITLWQSITSSSSLHSCEHSMTSHTDLCSLNETPSVASPPHIPVGFCHSTRFGLNKGGLYFLRRHPHPASKKIQVRLFGEKNNYMFLTKELECK